MLHRMLYTTVWTASKKKSEAGFDTHWGDLSRELRQVREQPSSMIVIHYLICLTVLQEHGKRDDEETYVKVKGMSQSPHSLLHAMLTTIRCSPRLGSRVGGNPRAKRTRQEVALIVLLLVLHVFVTSRPKLTNIAHA